MTDRKIYDLRQNYDLSNLDESDVAADPIVLFEEWFSLAVKNGVPEPNAMVLATSDDSGKVSQRTVLLKDFSEGFFEFYTNYNSKKAQDISVQPQVSLLFLWLTLQRQVRIEGNAEKVSRQKSETYFMSRPRQSCLAAWASQQSTVLNHKKLLTDQYNYYKEKFKDQLVPCPDFWGGYVVKPQKIEFWQGGNDRLHDRLLFTKENNQWHLKRLYP